MYAEKRLAEIGIDLDGICRKGASTLPCRRYGNLLFISSHNPVDKDGKTLTQGVAGVTLTAQDGYEAARQTAIAMLRTIKDEIGDLDRVDYFVKCLILVNADGDFSSTPVVGNGFSDVMVTVFGQRGQHARAAMGSFGAQDNAAVTIDAVIAIKD